MTNANENALGAVGWLIAQYGDHHEVLGSAWLIRNRVAVTCAHILIPYFDFPEVLRVGFPLSGQVFGVKEILVHGSYDPWLAKRNYANVKLFPALALANQPNNLAALTISESVEHLSRDNVARIAKALLRPEPAEAGGAISGKTTIDQLPNIVQNLLNAINHGTLTLTDMQNLPLARFYIKDMQVSQIEYENLQNERALNKLITTEDGEFKFFFVQEYSPEWVTFEPMSTSTADALAEAKQRYQLKTQLMTELGGADLLVRQKGSDLTLDGLPPEKQPPVACAWTHLTNPISLGRLIKSCRFDGSELLASVKYLAQTGQILQTKLPPPVVPSTVLEPANASSIQQGSRINSLSIDIDSGQGVQDFGYILDPIPSKGDGYFVHSIGLPNRAVGSPILADGEVVGIHSGLLTEGSEPYIDWIHPGLMIPVEAVYQCLDLSPERSTTEADAVSVPHEGADYSQTGGVFEGETADGVEEFIEEASPPAVSLRDTMTTLSSTRSGGFPLPGLGSGGGGAEPPGQKKSGFFSSIKGMLKGKESRGTEFIEIAILRQGLNNERFEEIKMTDIVRQGDLVRLRVKAILNCHIVVVAKIRGDYAGRLVYPEPGAGEEQLLKGHQVEAPQSFADVTVPGRKKVFAGLPVNASDGIDEIIIISAEQPLPVSEEDAEAIFDVISGELASGELFQSGKFAFRNGSMYRVADSEKNPDALTAVRIELRHGD